MAIDKRLLELLRCPRCKGELEYQAEPEYLKCHACRVQYPVKDGIPVMLIEEAEALPDSS